MKGSTMQAIRVGQIWQEKQYNQRTMRVDDLVMRQGRHGGTEEVFAARMVLVSGKGRPRTDIQAYILRSGWILKEEAPDAPLRKIALTLAKDTTATECGSCPLLQTNDTHVGSVTSCGRWGGEGMILTARKLWLLLAVGTLLGCPRPEPIPSGVVLAPAVCLTRNACCYYWCGQPSCACADGKAKPPPDMAAPEQTEAATPSTATIPPDNEFEGSEHEDPE